MKEHRRGLKTFARVDGIHPDGFGGDHRPASVLPGDTGLYLFHEGRPEVQEGQGPPVAGGEGDPPGNVSHPDRGVLSELRFQIGKGRLSPGRGKGCQDQGLRLFIGHRGDIAAGRVSAYRPGELPYVHRLPFEGLPAPPDPRCSPRAAGTGPDPAARDTHSCQGSRDLRYVLPEPGEDEYPGTRAGIGL